MTILFALNNETQEVIISASKNGSNQILNVGRVTQNQNPELYAKVDQLDKLVHSDNFSEKTFNNTYKECLMIWRKEAK